MRIIDFHTHTFPDRIAEAAIASLMEESRSRAHTDGTVNGLKASMETAGVDVSVVLPVVTNPVKASSMNNFAARVNEDFENSGVFSIGGIHPETPNLREVLREAKNLGLRGVKLHPDYYGIMFNDIKTKRVIDIASEMGLFVITHAGMDIGLYPPICCSIESIEDVLKDVEPETLILAHMGGWMNWEEVTLRLAGTKSYSSTKVYLDTAFSIGEIDWIDPDNHKDYHQMSDDMFRKMVKVFGSERIVFGSDSPWAEQKDYVDRMNAMGLRNEELEDIFHRNADKLLNLKR